MGLFSFIGVAVTSASIMFYGKAEWDPVVVLSKFTNPIVLVAAFALCVVRTKLPAPNRDDKLVP